MVDLLLNSFFSWIVPAKKDLCDASFEMKHFFYHVITFPDKNLVNLNYFGYLKLSFGSND